MTAVDFLFDSRFSLRFIRCWRTYFISSSISKDSSLSLIGFLFVALISLESLRNGSKESLELKEVLVSSSLLFLRFGIETVRFRTDRFFLIFVF